MRLMLMHENDARRMLVYSEGLRPPYLEFRASLGSVILLQLRLGLDPAVLGPHGRFGGLDGM